MSFGRPRPLTAFFRPDKAGSLSDHLPPGVFDPIMFVGRLSLYVAVSLAVVYTAVYVAMMWKAGAGIDGPAGIMIATAFDLTKGVFYRPLIGPLGYGGTRYFPLYFVLHALLMKLGIPVLMAGYMLSGIAILLLLAAVYCLLRRLGLDVWLAASCAGAVLASFCAQYVIISPHAEPLATALNVWGLAILVTRKPGSRKVLLAATFFTLSWSAKFTTCFGVVAAVVWLASTGSRKRALQLALSTLAGYSAIAVLMIVGSDGRVVGIFRACALGGTNWNRFLNGPLLMAWNAVRFDWNVFLLIFFTVAVFVADLLHSPSKWLQELPPLLFVATALTTMGIFGSPGTNANHLLDIQVACVIVLGSLATRAERLQRYLGVYALAFATLLPVGHDILLVITGRGPQSTRNGPAALQSVLGAIGKPDQSILSENPVVPVLSGQPAYVLDSFMLAIVRRRIPMIGDTLLNELHDRAFRAVVLQMDPKTEEGRDWYSRRDFGPGFVEALGESYCLLRVIDGQYVYTPAEANGSCNRTEGSRATQTNSRVAELKAIEPPQYVHSSSRLAGY